MSDDLPARYGETPPATPTVVPAFELDPGIFSRADWKLVLAEDGWYLVVDGSAERVTVDDAVVTIGKYGRAPVFKATREYIRDLGRRLAEDSYVSAISEPRDTAEHEMRARGLDPKLPAEHIARAGHVIGQLGDELVAAEAARH